MKEDYMRNLINRSNKQQIQKIQELNQYTKTFGVSLAEEEIVRLLESRRLNLKQEERVEFGEGILNKLVYLFCDSPYIYQENYAATIEALQEIFYLYKNECMDELSDDELLEYMKQQFDGECQGDLDYLEGTCLEALGREVRGGFQRFIGRYDEDDNI
jgi:hypothetical protein